MAPPGRAADAEQHGGDEAHVFLAGVQQLRENADDEAENDGVQMMPMVSFLDDEAHDCAPQSSARYA